MHLPKKLIDIIAFFKAYNVPLQLVFIPLAAGNLPAYFQSKESGCGFVLIIMSIFWITECLPFAITSILPVILFPLFGIMTSEKVSAIYFQDILMLFLGGLVLATTVEESDLHKRVAFRVIKLFGTNPLFLLLGMMFVTWFLSLWISNTATTAMMLPIVIAMCEEISELLFAQPKPAVSTVEFPHEIEVIFSHNEPYHTDPLKPLPAQRLLKGFMIGISYSAIIGGCGSLVGTSTNLILKGYFGQTYPQSKLNFFTYMMYALPIAIIMLILTWIVLCIIWLPRELLSFKHKTDLQKKENLKKFIHNEYLKLGPLNWEQISIGCLFLLLVFLWITRDLIFAPGWQYFFKEKYVTDTTPAILILVLLSTWPKNNIFKGLPYEPLITWKKINDTFPWNILLLAGGGLALAEGFKESGLSILIGDIFDSSLPKQKELELLIIILITQIGTELISNSSMVSIFLPIANALALKNNINPNYLLIPLTLSSNFSFMLPVSTPPNTIIFSTGFLQIRDLAISGFILKILGTGILFLSTLWIEPILGDPREFTATNSTISTTLRNFSTMI